MKLKLELEGNLFNWEVVDGCDVRSNVMVGQEGEGEIEWLDR